MYGDPKVLKEKAAEALDSLFEQANGMGVSSITVKFRRYSDENVEDEVTAIAMGTIRITGHSKVQVRKGRY